MPLKTCLFLKKNNKKEVIEYLENQSKNSFIIYVDGGSRGNPGESGVGIVFRHNSVKKGFYFYNGIATNNEAEYTALLKGLEIAIKKKYPNVKVYTDSELVFNQINGNYKVKSDNLKGLYKKSLDLVKEFKSFSISHIPRTKNKEADKLANLAMDLKKNGEVELTVAPHLFNGTKVG